ncbi:unnamed protein product, partial [Sphenostylis stenocarpa]
VLLRCILDFVSHSFELLLFVTVSIFFQPFIVLPLHCTLVLCCTLTFYCASFFGVSSSSIMSSYFAALALFHTMLLSSSSIMSCTHPPSHRALTLGYVALSLSLSI